MSIIHDALKKVQQEQTRKPDETPTAPATVPTSDYIYAPPPEPALQPIEHLPSKQNKARSVLAFLCALAFTLGSFIFLYKQLSSCVPSLNQLVKSSYFKLIHKRIVLDDAPQAPVVLKPLAQLTINPAPKKNSNPAKPVPITLNIHGIMSNGDGSNLVLINDQVYQEGDEVDGAKIVKVNLNSVTVINNGTEETISVKN